MKKQLLSALLLTGSLAAGTINTAAAQTPVFAYWPLTVNSADSAALRSANTTVNAHTLRHFVVADGANTVTLSGATTATTIKPYSSAFGEAFAPLAAGGGWGTSAGGPGGALKRPFSAQFSVSAPAGGTGLRADSLIVTSGFISTSSSTTMGVVYSKSGFASDSADVTGNKGPGAFVATTGGFATPITLAQITTLPNKTNTYRIALNGTTGVTIAAGQTLTVRIYFSCSSSGATSRYATLRNVMLKSTQVALATRAVANTNLGVYPNPAQSQLTVPHTAASRDAQVLVYNTTGARIFSQAVQPGSLETTVSLNALAKGLYLVEYADGGQRSTARIVKD
ncbi:T9SS type A sorting domain-containing protein [Hymenobacter sp. BRD67]|uniref:T9SS type A sorting domain-containing protein n=1 Tax=Hymenobacter sp. BRD67 TaxID=2675877 RepID=UPI001566C356|nr:T9SS type A sorting domain-containing protein [Hymenobacter sp. BRD67]QKG53055.1 T9SS type A sorting domain-containing protein [Hymenobacter sp. BRD67]